MAAAGDQTESISTDEVLDLILSFLEVAVHQIL
jgi:hypothetical protein